MHTHTHTHSHIHTGARAHTHIFPRLLKACLRELKLIGVGDRKKVNLQLRFEGRQSLSMSHREREIVPDGRNNERIGALSFEPFTSVRNTEDANDSRGAESAWWDVQLKEVGQIRRSSDSDHVVANCSNLVFYSAFYRQTVQIHKTVIVYPFLTVVFRRYRYIGGRGGIPRTQKKKVIFDSRSPFKSLALCLRGNIHTQAHANTNVNTHIHMHPHAFKAPTN